MIEGRELTVLTDHKPLTYAITKASSNNDTPRRHRQLDFISQFCSDIKNIPGDHNALSRMLCQELKKSASLVAIMRRNWLLAEELHFVYKMFNVRINFAPCMNFSNKDSWTKTMGVVFLNKKAKIYSTESHDVYIEFKKIYNHRIRWFCQRTHSVYTKQWYHLKGSNFAGVKDFVLKLGVERSDPVRSIRSS